MPLILGLGIGIIAYLVARDLAAKAEQKQQNQNQLPTPPGQTSVGWPTGTMPIYNGQSAGWPQIESAGRRSNKTTNNSLYQFALLRTMGSCCGSCAKGHDCEGCGG